MKAGLVRLWVWLSAAWVGQPRFYVQLGSVGFVVLQAIINKLWFGYDLEHAISAPVMHTQGEAVLFEETFSNVSGLGGKQIASATLLGNPYFASGSPPSWLNLTFSARFHTHILQFHTWQC